MKVKRKANTAAQGLIPASLQQTKKIQVAFLYYLNIHNSSKGAVLGCGCEARFSLLVQSKHKSEGVSQIMEAEKPKKKSESVAQSIPKTENRKKALSNGRIFASILAIVIITEYGESTFCLHFLRLIETGVKFKKKSSNEPADPRKAEKVGCPISAYIF